jgi:hypothetical protein
LPLPSNAGEALNDEVKTSLENHLAASQAYIKQKNASKAKATVEEGRDADWLDNEGELVLIN